MFESPSWWCRRGRRKPAWTTQRRRVKTFARSVGMAAAPLPSLPSDVLDRITRAALEAAGATAEARRCLGLVCRRWRDSLRGTLPAPCPPPVPALAFDECIFGILVQFHITGA